MTLLEIFDPKAPAVPIGIDLGTTNSLVARMRDGKPVVIADCNDLRLIPSAVYFGDRGQVIVGTDALKLASEYPKQTILSVKRFMGRGANDPETQKLGTYEFAKPSTDDEAKSVRFVVNNNNITPIEVSAHILRVLKNMAEDELRSVGGAVITVPAYFDDAQRQATKDAARLAGIEVLRLLNEPTAAALAYGLEQKQNGVFAVYDLGGGTFDITILLLENGLFQVKSTGGDSALGGDDMDRALAEYLLNAFAITNRNAAIIRYFLNIAKKAKHDLSSTNQTLIENPFQPTKSAIELSRETFESLILPIVERTGTACRRALRDAGISATEIDGIILVGGSTRVPLVKAYVEKIFEKPPLDTVDPDEVVAMGAAIQADILAGSKEFADDILLLDVLPLSLGIETMGGIVEKILPRNTTIPAGARQVFTTYADNQTGFDLHVLQGERELASDCRSLARFFLKGIPPMPAGMARLEITFRVDADGLLHVSAKELTTGIEQTIDVKPSYGLTDEQVEQMLLAALDHGEEDFEQRKLIEARVEAERVLLATNNAMKVDGFLLSEPELKKIQTAISELQHAIQGTKAHLIQAKLEALDHATHEWAGLRMNRAIAKAIEGKSITDVETSVEQAKGVDAHVAEHQRNIS